MGDRDSIKASVDVAVPPLVAFTLFTRDIGAWWRHGKDLGTGHSPRTGTLHFQGEEGGTLIEVYPDRPAFTVGGILIWRPGEHLAFEWRSGNFLPGQTTRVDISFQQTTSGTRIELMHHGLDGLPSDHSARHGLGRSDAFLQLMRDHWQRAIDEYCSHVAANSAGGI